MGSGQRPQPRPGQRLGLVAPAKHRRRALTVLLNEFDQRLDERRRTVSCAVQAPVRPIISVAGHGAAPPARRCSGAPLTIAGSTPAGGRDPQP